MGWRLLPGFAILAVGVAFAPDGARACSCALPPPPLESLAAADAVFEGVVIHNERAGHERVVQIQVAQVWKGEIPARMTVFTADSEASCGVTLPVGIAFLVYGRRQDDQLVVSLCSRTSPLGDAQQDLAALGPGRPPSSGDGGWATKPEAGGCSLAVDARPPPAALTPLALAILVALRRRRR